MIKTTTYGSRKEVEVTQFLGLRSAPSSIVDPDKLTQCTNYYFTRPGVLKSREGASHLYYDFNEDHSYGAVEFTNSGGTSFLVWVKGREILYWTGTGNSTTLVFGGSTNILSSSTEFRGITEYNNAVYIADGSSTLYKWGGGAVTQLTVPLSGTYGNPVSVFNFASSLAVLTDQGYLRYTQVGTDSVWEERAVLPGTVAASGTTITGTNTIFTSSAVTKGQRVIITDGTNEEEAYILSIGSDTSITLSAPLSNTYSAGSSLFLAGLDLYEPIEIGDGLIPRKAVQFGKYLAIAKTARDTERFDTKLLVYSISTRDPNASQLAANFNDSGIKFLQRETIEQSFTLHPFSLVEYENTVMFLADDNVYALSQSEGNANKFVAIPVSRDKLENELKNINTNKRSNSHISVVRKGDVNLICIHFTEDVSSSFNNRILAGYRYPDGTFEFTTLQIPTRTEALEPPVRVFDHSLFAKFQDKILLIGTQATLECFNDSFRADNVINGALEEPLISSTDILISSTTLNISGYFSGAGVNIPIQRSVRFGTFRNENHNRLNMYRFFVIVSETKATPTFTAQTYYMRMYINGASPGREIAREYDKGLTVNVITFDNTDTYTFDSTDWTFDSDFLPATQKRPLEYVYRLKKVTTTSLQIFDFESDGILEIIGYGIQLEAGRYA